MPHKSFIPCPVDLDFIQFYTPYIPWTVLAFTSVAGTFFLHLNYIPYSSLHLYYFLVAQECLYSFYSYFLFHTYTIIIFNLLPIFPLLALPFLSHYLLQLFSLLMFLLLSYPFLFSTLTITYFFIHHCLSPFLNCVRVRVESLFYPYPLLTLHIFPTFPYFFTSFLLTPLYPLVQNPSFIFRLLSLLYSLTSFSSCAKVESLIFPKQTTWKWLRTSSKTAGNLKTQR